MAVTFDIKKILLFSFDILKGNRNILNINSGFCMNTKFNPNWRTKNDNIILFVFGLSKSLMTSSFKMLMSANVF